jgi:sterol desaturase/sphingolipid hydroxylase (fatty acid hydroxylase superfamily)
MDVQIVWAFPFFFALLGIEMLASRILGRRDHLLEDMVTDISCGIGEQLTGALARGLVFAGYVLLYHQVAPFHFEKEQISAWIIGMVGVDLSYYWWHRFSHRTHIGWATHVPHHQSQDYNLAVALRQSWTSKISMAPFHWPLAILGIPPVVVLVSEALGLLYQFWIHTRLVDRLGPLEWFMNTPSHHRVHHGIETKYLDHNYGSILIIWDRLFGTFQREEEEPTYGTVRPYESWDPFWANLVHFSFILQMLRKAETLTERLTLWFRPPEWTPASMGGLQTPRARVRPAQDLTWRHRQLAPGARVYVVLWSTLCVLTTMAILMLLERLPPLPLICVGLGVMVTTWTIARLLHRGRAGLRLEMLRLTFLATLSATWILEYQPDLGIALLTLSLTSAAWLWLREEWFHI